MKKIILLYTYIGGSLLYIGEKSVFQIGGTIILKCVSVEEFRNFKPYFEIDDEQINPDDYEAALGSACCSSESNETHRIDTVQISDLANGTKYRCGQYHMLSQTIKWSNSIRVILAGTTL